METSEKTNNLNWKAHYSFEIEPDIRRRSTIRTWGCTVVCRMDRTRRRWCTNFCRWPAAPSELSRSETASPSSSASPHNCHRRYVKPQNIHRSFSGNSHLQWNLIVFMAIAWSRNWGQYTWLSMCMINNSGTSKRTDFNDGNHSCKSSTSCKSIQFTYKLPW